MNESAEFLRDTTYIANHRNEVVAVLGQRGRDGAAILLGLGLVRRNLDAALGLHGSEHSSQRNKSSGN